MDLQHLLGVIVAVLNDHQHSLLLDHLLDHCVDDLFHLVGLLHGADQTTLEVYGDEIGAELVLGKLIWIGK